jgi:hypothetical protein
LRFVTGDVHLRDADAQARMLVAVTAQSLVRPGIGSVVELLHHQVRWSGEVRCRVVHGCVRLGVDDLIGSDGDPPTSRGMTSRYWSTIRIDGRPPAGCSSRHGGTTAWRFVPLGCWSGPRSCTTGIRPAARGRLDVERDTAGSRTGGR